MKNLTTNLMVAAAALMVVAGSASAQVLKAEIPFGFTVNDTKLAPGTYHLNLRNSGVPVIQVFSPDTRTSVLVLANVGNDAPQQWRANAKPILSFACVEGRCNLRSVYNGEDRSVLSIPAGKHARADLAGVEIVNIRAVKAD